MNWRKILKPMLMLAVIIAGISIAFSALQNRPEIRVSTVGVDGFAKDLQPIIDRCNADVRGPIEAAQLQSADPASNLVIARRIALGLIGSGLSLEEVRALQLVPESQQIAWVTNYLLQDRRWADYFAERFSRAMLGTDDGPFILFRRRRFTTWLSDKLYDDTGYDTIVRQVISAEGLWTDTPQVNFITASMSEGNNQQCDPVVLAGRTSRTFLAQRIDCLQCHNDFIDQHNFGTTEKPVDGEQIHFHNLAAFYGSTGIKDNPFSGIRERGDKYHAQLLGSTDKQEVEADVPFYKNLLSDEGKPRQRLAAWVTHPDNKAFSRATVNRVWALLFSRPLVDPVDSIPLHGEIPPILDSLAEDFARHEFNMRRLIRIIVSTEAFQRDSRAEFDLTEEHESKLAAFPITQLRPDQVAGSMIQAARVTAIDSDSSVFVRLARYGNRNDFLRDFGDRGLDEFQSDAITITQRLVLMNGNLVAERTKEDLVGNAATRIARFIKDDKKAIETIFLSVFGRIPSGAEMDSMCRVLAEKYGGDRVRAVNDIYWAMLNSTEFAWNH
ncbi:MAG: DUF1553 domain-containing protein [Pirellulales bacterium]